MNWQLLAEIPAEEIGLSTVVVYNDTDVEDGKTYYYRVTALNGVGESEMGNQYMGWTSPPEPRDAKWVCLTFACLVGIILIVVAIVWWTVIGPMLTKLPNDVDTQMDFDGNLTLYVDPTTKQPLAAGDETVIPITVLRTFKSVPDLSTSSVGVFEDTIVTTMAGQQTAPS